MRKLLLLFLICLCAACNPSRSIPNDTLVMGLEAKPQQLDPRLGVDSTSQRVNKIIYSGLLKLDQDLKLVPDLAEALHIENPTTYKFILKRGVLFHNGEQLTSADVRATYESMQSDKLSSPFKSSLALIKEIETPDAHTVIFKLKEPNAPFLTLMSLGIIPKSFVDGDSAPRPSDQEVPPGSGPFQFVSAQNSLGLIELTRFDNYFGEKAKTKNLTFRVIQDTNLRALETIKGRVDLVQNAVPFVLIPELKKRDDLQFVETPGVVFAYLAFNFKNPYLKDPVVRQAFAHAIDREKIIRYKLSGVAETATSFMGPRHWVFDKNLKPLAFDPQKAKKLLDDAGYKDPDGDGPLPRFTLVYKTSSLKERVEIAQLIAEQMRAVGVELEVRPYEFGTFFRDVRQGNFDVYTLTWSGITDPDIYYTICHSSMIPPNGANRGTYINPHMDKLLDESRVTIDHTKQKEIYDEIQALALNDLVYIPLWYENNFVFMNPHLKGYTPTANSSFVGLVNAYKADE